MRACPLDSSDYARFLEIMRSPFGQNVRLDDKTARSLVSHRVVWSPVVATWSICAILSVISLVVTPFLSWGGWWSAGVSLLCIMLCVRWIKKCSVSAVWRELLGKGRLDYATREELFEYMARSGYLFILEENE